VYPLPQGARVRDLVSAAGGLLQAATSRLGFGAQVADGQEYS
jgi:hypothetical protein